MPEAVYEGVTNQNVTDKTMTVKDLLSLALKKKGFTTPGYLTVFANYIHNYA